MKVSKITNNLKTYRKLQDKDIAKQLKIMLDKKIKRDSFKKNKI